MTPPDSQTRDQQLECRTESLVFKNEVESLNHDSNDELIDTVSQLVGLTLLVAAGSDPADARNLWDKRQPRLTERLAEYLEQFRTHEDVALNAAINAALSTGVPNIESYFSFVQHGITDPLMQADIQRAAAKISTWQGDIVSGATRTQQMATEVTSHDPERAAWLYLDAATMWLTSGHLEAAKSVASDAVALCDVVPQMSEPALLLHNLAALLTGDSHQVEFCDTDALDAFGKGDVRVGVMTSNQLLWSCQFDEARRLLGKTESVARATGPDTLPYVLAVVSDLNFRTGWWRSGRVAAEQGIATAPQAGSRNVRALLVSLVARFDAVTGNAAECLIRLDEVEEVAQTAGLLNLRLHAASTRLVIALGAGNYEAAVAHGQHAQQISLEMGLLHRGYEPFEPNLIEALIRIGEPVRAKEVLVEFDQRCEQFNLVSGLAGATRCKVLLTDKGRLEREINEATRLHERTGEPFETARTHLIIGEQQRRYGLRSESRVTLMKAHREFARLGAPTWAARALAALRAAGGRGIESPSGHSRFDEFSPQERQVIRVVADGASNKKAAAALYLSQKSIERHLTTIYRKLGIRSRSELVRWHDDLS